LAAYVHPSAVVGENYQPAPFTLIDAEVVIGANVITGSFVHVRFGASIGG
jgi:UDP-N-acetylglucosamine acyltransferase